LKSPVRNLAQSTRAPARIEPNSGVPEPAYLGPVYWRPPRDIDFEEWARHGHRLGAAGRGASWWIGDWLNYGEAKYGEHYIRASVITGYEVQSLMNMAYVASHFEISRRRENVSWSHHAELAALPPGEQDAWLDRVEAARISVRELRQERRRLEATPAREHTLSAGETICPACGHRWIP
jgi:hypothetical protein